MTEAETIKALVVLRASYPNQTIPPETVDIYSSMLMPLDAETTMRAIKRVLRRCRFFPTLAEIHEAYDAICEEDHSRLPDFTGLADMSPDEARKFWGVITYDDDTPELPNREHRAS